uniref:ATP-dependent RNA helicase n=1 Tax=Anthurium amnicola TaxID=1678845 RepID=A0A1D1Z3G9_9ARAE
MMRCQHLFCGKLLPRTPLPPRLHRRKRLFLLPLSKLSSLSKPFSTSAVSPPSSSSASSLCSRLKATPASGRATRPFSTAVAAVEQEGAGGSTFHAEEGVTWRSLGISDRISRALSSVSLDRPSLIQAACIPHIFSGNDVIIAAETGSGKTHGYLVPLFHKLCSLSEQSTDGSDQLPPKPSAFSLVLCPNVMLCKQVVEMANFLCDDQGKPLLKISTVCGQQGWPIIQPDILVSTPAALLNSLFAFDAENHRRPEFVKAVKHVIGAKMA